MSNDYLKKVLARVHPEFRISKDAKEALHGHLPEKSRFVRMQSKDGVLEQNQGKINIFISQK